MDPSQTRPLLKVFPVLRSEAMEAEFKKTIDELSYCQDDAGEVDDCFLTCINMTTHRMTQSCFVFFMSLYR